MGRARWAVLVLGVACSDHDPLEGASFVSIAEGRPSAEVLYTSASNGLIYRTRDGGKSWATVTAPWPSDRPDSVSRIAVSPADSDVVLVGTDLGRIYRSTDGGDSWRLAPDPAYTDYIQRLAFHPRRADRVYGISAGDVLISTDGGQSFTAERELTSASPSCRINDYCGDVAFDATDDRVYAACSNGVVVSVNGGACWAPSSSSPPHTSAIIASPSESGHVWVAAIDGVWASADGAQSFSKLTDWSTVYSWPDVPSRPPEQPTITITSATYSVGSSGPTLLFATSDVGVVNVRTDTGTTTDVGASLVRRAGAIEEIIAAPNGVFIATNATCRGLGGVFFSGDQGGTWSDVLMSHALPDLTQPIGDPIPHELIIIFYRDVSIARQDEIMAEHHVTPEYPGLTGPLMYGVSTAPDDPRSVADLLQEFEALDEIDCAMNDFSMSTH